MRVTIQKEIQDTFNPIIGVIYAYNIDNSKEVSNLEALMNEATKALKEQCRDYENVGQHPTIAAWRNAYKTFGTDPKRYRSSIEALSRRVLKDEPLPRINTLVDLYNSISIKYMLPLGGENIDTIEGDLTLAFADGTEEFIVLNGNENEPPAEGEVVYKDDRGVICRRWNWREAERTKLTKDTKNAAIVIDAIPPTTQETVEKATQELAGLIQTHCGGEVETEILS